MRVDLLDAYSVFTSLKLFFLDRVFESHAITTDANFWLIAVDIYSTSGNYSNCKKKQSKISFNEQFVIAHV